LSWFSAANLQKIIEKGKWMIEKSNEWTILSPLKKLSNNDIIRKKDVYLHPKRRR
jgi:hypothetical protein